jgi:hypothetical protein
MKEIGHQVLEAICRDLEEWQRGDWVVNWWWPSMCRRRN